VTSLPAEDKLTIAVVISGRQRFMDRPKAEALERTLTRMQMNAAKPGAQHFANRGVYTASPCVCLAAAAVQYSVRGQTVLCNSEPACCCAGDLLAFFQPPLPAARTLSPPRDSPAVPSASGPPGAALCLVGGRKGKGRGASTEPLPPAVSLLEGAPGTAPLAGATPNADAWLSGRTLRVGDELYHVVVNPPSVLKARAARLMRSTQRLE